MLVQALNNKGRMFIKKEWKNNLKTNNSDGKKFSEEKEIYAIAEIMNLFLAELFPVYLKKY